MIALTPDAAAKIERAVRARDLNVTQDADPDYVLPAMPKVSVTWTPNESSFAVPKLTPSMFEPGMNRHARRALAAQRRKALKKRLAGWRKGG
jgi:hypothetical protein